MPFTEPDPDRPDWECHRAGIQPGADHSFSNLFDRYRDRLIRRFQRLENSDPEGATMYVMFKELGRRCTPPPDRLFRAFIFWKVRAKNTADRRKSREVAGMDLAGFASQDRQSIDALLGALDGYIDCLLQKRPRLNHEEGRHYLLRALGLDSTEIAGILQISRANEYQKWKRLRKKMIDLYGIDPDEAI